MAKFADRASGIFFVVFGVFMYLWVIPKGIDNIPDGNLNPNALPNLLSLGIVLCGGILMVRPTAHQVRDIRHVARAGVFVAVLVVALYAMSFIGFLPVAPILALAVMLIIGERRPVWLVVGVAGVPATIWVLVTQVLDRSLP